MANAVWEDCGGGLRALGTIGADRWATMDLHGTPTCVRVRRAGEFPVDRTYVYFSQGDAERAGEAWVRDGEAPLHAGSMVDHIAAAAALRQREEARRRLARLVGHARGVLAEAVEGLRELGDEEVDLVGALSDLTIWVGEEANS